MPNIVAHNDALSIRSLEERIHEDATKSVIYHVASQMDPK